MNKYCKQCKYKYQCLIENKNYVAGNYPSRTGREKCMHWAIKATRTLFEIDIKQLNRLYQSSILSMNEFKKAIENYV